MTAPLRGTCFGFGIESSVPLEFLRDGDGVRLAVDDGATESPAHDAGLLYDWPATGEQPRTRLFEADGAYRYCVDGGGCFVVEPAARRVTIPMDQEPLRREERLWTLPLLLCFAARGDTPLHAAAVEADGGAIVIAAPRTFGKTTLAAGFLAEGHRVLTEDIACIRFADEPQVIPGPAMLRVRADVAERLSFDGAQPAGRDEARLHLALAADRRGTCDPVPLRGIVFLRESGELQLERVGAPTALRDLWELNFRFNGAAAFGSSFEALADLVREVPAWNLYRPLQLDRLGETVEAVLASV